MVRLLALALACVVPLAALARPEGGGAKDYQRLAEQSPAPAAAPTGRATELPPGYSIQRLPHPKRGNDSQTVVSKRGERVIAWDTALPQFFVHRGVIYRAEYHSGCPGCSVIAFDLGAGKELWRARLRATGVFAPHSFYLNGVTIERFDESTLRVSGRETFGDYVEYVDLETGKTVGHKAVHPEWMKRPLSVGMGE